uniref:SRPBCC family protein n=1 Tax=Thermus islandicus TaxID=540988 RepID=A0A7C2FV24_9DEIN
MPEIHVERFLPFPPERVYALAKDLEGLKPFLPDIQTLRVLGREGNRTRTEWVGVAMGKKVRWIEEEEWDDAHLRNRFWSPEGDFDRYEGTWAFLPENGGTRVVLDLTYELTLPLFGSLLKQLVHKLMQENAASLLKGLEDRVRAG